MSLSVKQIELFQSIFKGREDIYARRWENEDRDGYVPAYNVDWDRYEKHKALGGTFQNFKHKEPAFRYPSITVLMTMKHSPGFWYTTLREIS